MFFFSPNDNQCLLFGFACDPWLLQCLVFFSCLSLLLELGFHVCQGFSMAFSASFSIFGSPFQLSELSVCPMAFSTCFFLVFVFSSFLVGRARCGPATACAWSAWPAPCRRPSRSSPTRSWTRPVQRRRGWGPLCGSTTCRPRQVTDHGSWGVTKKTGEKMGGEGEWQSSSTF